MNEVMMKKLSPRALKILCELTELFLLSIVIPISIIANNESLPLFLVVACLTLMGLAFFGFTPTPLTKIFLAVHHYEGADFKKDVLPTVKKQALIFSVWMASIILFSYFVAR